MKMAPENRNQPTTPCARARLEAADPARVRGITHPADYDAAGRPLHSRADSMVPLLNRGVGPDGYYVWARELLAASDAFDPVRLRVFEEVYHLWDRGLPPRKRTQFQQRFYDGNNDALRLLVRRVFGMDLDSDGRAALNPTPPSCAENGEAGA